MPSYLCPHCGQEMTIAASDEGRERICPACSEPFTVPQGAASDAGPAAQQGGRGLAAASLILGIAAYPLCVLAPIAAVPAVICGHVALSKRRAGEPRGMAAAGLILGYVAFGYTLIAVLMAAILLPSLARAREAARRASCAANLKQAGVICRVYQSEDEAGYWPPISPEAGNLAMDGSAVRPGFLSDLAILRCPSDPDATHPPQEIDDDSYVYLGHVVRDQRDLERFAEVYQEAARGGSIAADLSTENRSVLRLKQGVERFYITDINNPASGAVVASTTPVMWEWPTHHTPEGGNVLFMDGHIEFLRMGERFPMTEAAFEILRELDALGP